MNDNEQMIADLRSVIDSLQTTKLEALKSGNSRKEIICEDKINIINDLINELLLKNNDEDIVWRAKSILAEYGIDREDEKIRKLSRKLSRRMAFGCWMGFAIGLIVSIAYNCIIGLRTTINHYGQVIKDTIFPVYSIIYSAIFGFLIGGYCVIKLEEKKKQKNDDTYTKK